MTRARDRRRECGLSYIEVLVATALVAIALVPAIEALRTSVRGSEVYASVTDRHYHLASRLEELLAEPLSELDDEAMALADPTTASDVYSDASGAPSRRLVFLSRYDGDDVDPADGDPFTGMDEGLIWIRVEIEGTHLALERVVHVHD